MKTQGAYSKKKKKFEVENIPPGNAKYGEWLAEKLQSHAILGIVE